MRPATTPPTLAGKNMKETLCHPGPGNISFQPEVSDQFVHIGNLEDFVLVDMRYQLGTACPGAGQGRGGLIPGSS